MHRRADLLVGLGAGHPDLLAVVDERHAGTRQQQPGRELQPRRIATQLAGDAVQVVVGQERSEGTVRVQPRHPGQGATQGVAAAAAGRRHVDPGQAEVEAEVQRVGHVARARGGGVEDLAERQGTRIVASMAVRKSCSQACVSGVFWVTGPVLDQVLRGVEPEAVDADVAQPERRRAFVTAAVTADCAG